jgi:hypothetical protein
MVSQLKGFGPNIQHLAIEKTFLYSMVKDSLPPYLNNLAIIKQNHQNLKDGMNTNLMGPHQFKVVMANDNMCTFASSQIINSGKGIAKDFTIDRRNIKNVVVQKNLNCCFPKP